MLIALETSAWKAGCTPHRQPWLRKNWGRRGSVDAAAPASLIHSHSLVKRCSYVSIRVEKESKWRKAQ